jgi:hypothetical protein
MLKKSQIDTIEFYTINLGPSCQFQHGVEGNYRLGVRAFSYNTRPHGVVEFRIVIFVHKDVRISQQDVRISQQIFRSEPTFDKKPVSSGVVCEPVIKGLED